MNSRYTYTRDGRLESLLHEDKEGVLDRFDYTYDTVGNCIAEERERRNLPEESGSYRYIYDELGRLTVIEKDGEILGSYEYDAYGNRTGERKNGEEIRYSYNEVNQLVRRERGQKYRTICMMQMETCYRLCRMEGLQPDTDMTAQIIWSLRRQNKAEQSTSIMVSGRKQE